MQSYFRRHIAIPQDHGAWVFILSPLSVGFFAGNNHQISSLFLFIAAMIAFVIRQPMTVFVKSISGRRSASDLAPARFWILVYGLILALVLLPLLRGGFGYILYLAVPGVPVFFWHLWLVSRREERGQAGMEIVATGVLSLAAPAMYWAGIGAYDPAGWWLWVLTWFQSAASIVYAYLRLKQRDLTSEQAKALKRSDWWAMGFRSFGYTSFNTAAVLLLGIFHLLPPLIFIPYLVQSIETVWGITHPSVGWKPARIGLRQLIVSILWTILFVIFWK